MSSRFLADPAGGTPFCRGDSDAARTTADSFTVAPSLNNLI